MNRSILIVDDDASVRESMGGVLRDEGYSVSEAADGHAALESLAAELPGLVLLDVWMPGLDGIDLLARIREIYEDLPVVVVSGHGNVETAVRATRLGASDFLEKPFSIDGLLRSVGRALSEDDVISVEEQGGFPAVRPTSPGQPLLRQRTLASSVVGGGLGLHSGVRTGVILHPLGPGNGIRFAGVGSDSQVLAHVDNVDSTGYATSLYRDGVAARTIEHLMAALHAYGVTNLLVKVEGEVPILDGSAVEFCELLESAGFVDQDADIAAVTVDNEIRLEPGPDQFIVVTPADRLEVTYELSYPDPVGDQVYTFVLDSPAAFKEQIAPARTFGFVEEIRQLEGAGLGQGGQLSNFILIGEGGIVNTELRFVDELARHKILDLLGDLYLLGAPLLARVHARKTGHGNNVELVRAIAAAASV
ncbi:MAG TPA: UDP-3-O-[3-hydroxymyristoyl] N-acetylglucosamine deacetylase [Deltaproteobacteria bacterium]|nr:UDP-3-O-[3-hydroxymyristoyl] N-acetylglucosamine deacetylase [Candidatus Binatota bacterium]HIL13508.1 UDP-3-O-[3-hydroxymyristoyl] N-acetylglucosamine deacetylase [Deltaproteobacteria bacterium]